MDKFNTLKMFLAAHDHGSFGGAANALGTDPSTISKAISRLEQQLKYQLFFRSTRRLQITPAGRHYLETVRKLLLELEACEQGLARDNEHASGVLTLNLPVAYGRFYIMPLLPEFTRRYPDIQLNITFSDEYVDIIEQGVDLSIRTGTLSDSRLVVQQLSPMDFVICASPDYLKNHPQIEYAQQLVDHPWIRFRFKQTGKLMPLLLGANVQNDTQLNDTEHNQFVVDDGIALLELCKGGMGLMQGPHFMMRPELLSGELVPLFPPINPPGFGVYLLYPKHRFPSKRVAVFIDFLKQALADRDESTHQSWARKLKPANPWR